MENLNPVLKFSEVHILQSSYFVLCITILIFIGFIYMAMRVLENPIAREIFSGESGRLSSTRFTGFIVVIIILGNWTYYNMSSKTFNPLSGDLLMAIIAAIYGPTAQSTARGWSNRWGSGGAGHEENMPRDNYPPSGSQNQNTTPTNTQTVSRTPPSGVKPKNTE